MSDARDKSIFCRLCHSTTWSDAMGKDKYGRIVDWFTSRFFCFGVLVMTLPGLAAGFGSKDWHDGLRLGLRVFALSLLLAGASIVGGWVLGLIFGVPRSPSQPNGTQQPAAAGAVPARNPTSKVNTNLEDISDWLTKIIIGVGLTQLNNFAGIIDGYAWNVAGGFGWGSYGHLLAIGLFFYFLPGGFWLGYIGTRTLVTLLFGAIDQTLSSTQLDRAAQIAVDENGVKPPAADQKTVDATLLAKPLAQLTTPEELKGWAGAQARSGNFESARVAAQTVLTDDPKDQEATRQMRAIKMGQMVMALYKAPPEGYEDAIRIGKELSGDPVAANDANLHLWLACGYAQKYGDMKKSGKSTPADLDTVRKSATDQIEETLTLDPSKRALLYSLLRPAPGSNEDDLKSLDDDGGVLAKELGT